MKPNPDSPARPTLAPASSDSFREHYAASQLRIEKWNELKVATERLAREGERGAGAPALLAEVNQTLELLRRVEAYWAFPGKRTCAELASLAARGWYRILSRNTARIVRLLVSDAYRRRDLTQLRAEEKASDETRADREDTPEVLIVHERRPYFEVLVVDDISAAEEAELRHALLDLRSDDDEFIYDVVVVPSFEDGVIGVLFNHNIQSCVLRYRFPVAARHPMPELQHYIDMVDPAHLAAATEDPSSALAEAIRALRPELDLFKVTDDMVGSVSATRTRWFRRVIYRQEDYLELHLSILKGIRERYDAPFFSALRDYSHKPTGVFHALPISRAKSITKSHWIQDMGRFYGRNIFLAETSSTTGGLDSLLQPTGPLKSAQAKVARAFGSRQSYFVTNGTSTANKIVTQALIRPGDLVLLSHDCHKSHPYALMLAGAFPVYLDAYPLDRYTMFGGVPLKEIKGQLLALRAAGKLDSVRMLLLTSSTFDGIVYDPLRVMREVLAIKPDIIFLWDEAWFAFARATPTYRQRTAMDAAQRLRRMLADPAYRERHAAWKANFDARAATDEAAWLEDGLLPDPDATRVRVYATHSTHKTLTALRQGSMIHVHDQDFERKARESFHDAYMTHTSTSPNYQILASLDVGRRQLELEGYEFVRNSVGLAMMLRRQISDHPLLAKYFRVLKPKHLIPAEYRPSGLERFYDAASGFTRMEAHWREDEFALDPTRITVDVSATGMDGNTFRRLLSDEHDIQVNKTSRNTVLFIVNIGSSRGSATYLLDVLLRIADGLERRASEDDMEREAASERVSSLAEQLPPLPHFSSFHPVFVPDKRGGTREGDLRSAYFAAHDPDNSEYLLMDGSVQRALDAGRTVVSASFVTPYPPGFPILVPGQVVTEDILTYLRAVDVKEIHGYEPSRGLRVFTDEALARLAAS